jgi:flagellar basal body-associated protein FliL
MKGKLKIIIPLALLIVLGGLYKVVLAKPPVEKKPKVDGHVYVMPKQFLLNLSDEHFAKLDVALVLSEEAAKEMEAGGHSGATPPEGFGALEQEAVVRAVITDEVTDASTKELVDRKGRKALRKKVLKALHEETDVEINDVLFTDVAVQ